MESKDLQLYFPTINYIIVEKLREFNIKAIGRFYNEDFKVLDHDHDWVLMTKGKSKSKTLKEKILDIELHRLEATEETWELACKFLNHKHSVPEEESE
ncbi:hypothetical protein H5410_036139 [Solanum commersonii]|uniref:Uncharacterized protein n=1 Tax=Solanum commersonii TaxID=4109 RepID=A0A9J5Y2Q3_SOLCO|nr:hypothetical protein H5410_036139 [Solanum commersonii]